MPYRDEHGHFISEEEARSRGLIEEPEVEEEVEEEPVATPTPTWGAQATGGELVFIDTGRGQTVEVPAGSPFEETLNSLAEDAHYGGYFRIFLNGSEVINPSDSPPTIELGMRVAITSYDKVG